MMQNASINGLFGLLRNELIQTGCNVHATVKSSIVTMAGCTSLYQDDDDENGSATDRCSVFLMYAKFLWYIYVIHFGWY
jgi:hypothetical protein